MLALGIVWVFPAKAAASGKPPNIVFLLADDLGYADLGFLPYAAKDVKTPNLDRLAAGGSFFADAYVTSPICSASRAGIITGQYQERWGNYSLGMGGDGLPAGEPTIPLALRDLGYATKKVGKNHFGGGDASPPWKHGFDEFLGFDGSTKSYVRLSQKDVDRMGRENAMFYTVAAGPLLRHDADGKNERVSFEDSYITDVFADEAVDYVRRDHGGKPFYLQVSFNAVHHPQYELAKRQLDALGLEELIWTPDCGLSASKWHEKHGWLGEVDPDGRKRYLACLFAMDEAVGKILQALEEKGLSDNTLVVFASDNGGSPNTYACNGPLHGHKYTITEGGVRIPLIMRWPGKIPAGKTWKEPVLSLDIFPTCVEAAGGTPPDKLDGRSLLPLLSGEAEGPVHEALFWDQGKAERPDWAVRAGKWKLHLAPGSGPTRTYCGTESYGRKTKQRNGLTFFDYPTPSGLLLVNLEKDPGEQENLAKQMPEKVEELTALYKSWRAEMHEPFKRSRGKK